MMNGLHKHKGVLTSTGTLRAHLISRKHKDSLVQRYHNQALKNCDSKQQTIKKSVKYKKGSIKESKAKFAKHIIDSEGYIFVDLTERKQIKGIRIKFCRREQNKKRTVGLQIEK